MKLTLNWSIAAQVVATILHVLNYASGVVPPRYQPYIALALGILQALGAFIAHFNNPDGTSASQPYKPAK